MANRCYTIYKIQGTEKAVKELFTAIVSLQTAVYGLEHVLDELKTTMSKRLWLGDLAAQFGIDCEGNDIHCRGHIYKAEYEPSENLLTVETITAWVGCNYLFYIINKVLGGELSISHRECEERTELFRVHDEGGFFPEECIVYGIGKRFKGLYYVYFDTIEAAIHEWCSRMGVERGDKSEEEMVEYINKYDYTDEGNYFHLYKITVV